VVGLIVSVVGFVLIFFGAILVLSQWSSISRIRRLRRPPTPIASITKAGIYNIRGRTSASEQGTLKAPLTDREALIYRVLIVAIGGGSAANSGSYTADLARGQVEFNVDDGSGRSLRVSADDSVSYLVPKIIFDGRRPFSGDAPQEILDWTNQRLGHPRDNVTVDERVIEPGQQVSLVGPVLVESDAQGGSTPKMTSPTKGALIIDARPEGAARSVVSVLIAAAVVMAVGLCAVGVSWTVL
jgi:hypothetical protein